MEKIIILTQIIQKYSIMIGILILRIVFQTAKIIVLGTAAKKMIVLKIIK